ncbi:MAG: hypothetical protein ACLP7Q_13225 [Isosphaeraceae bacterium]
MIAAAVVESWSFPGWYEKFITDVKQQPDLFGPVDREEAVRDAVRLAIDDQLRAGLDRISDGEMQRVDFDFDVINIQVALSYRAGPGTGNPGHGGRHGLALGGPAGP